MTTTLRVRAVPVGAAIQLTRRALALGPARFTQRRVLELLADWWELGPISPSPGMAGLPPDPFTWALGVLETDLT